MVNQDNFGEGVVPSHQLLLPLTTYLLWGAMARPGDKRQSPLNFGEFKQQILPLLRQGKLGSTFAQHDGFLPYEAWQITERLFDEEYQKIYPRWSSVNQKYLEEDEREDLGQEEDAAADELELEILYNEESEEND